MVEKLSSILGMLVFSQKHQLRPTASLMTREAKDPLHRLWDYKYSGP